jgi:hypothetical protein
MTSGVLVAQPPTTHENLAVLHRSVSKFAAGAKDLLP